ncbi:efflux RND transporter periplasmic adaptor subunit [Sneathiella litorea]|uniref:Efflux RND transporter periplasmic adaptor subunit n=1 Tax=Sneathiella litorea TaxID=2606216 RepID=A0A6L8W7B1_9PROT|nr:efflux RND transporter periplasmic adaptor subunit [Sneathiella litorea]MZR30589.1 efflux RND transporter periplasmic adaptor subunit [Sneathiella litorea]
MNRSIIIAIVIAVGVTAWIASGQIDFGGDSEDNASGAAAATQAEGSAAETTGDAKNKPKIMGVRYQNFTAQPREQEIIVHGRTEANRVVDLKAEISGRVKKVHADVGDRVKAKDPIVSFDVKDNQARLQEAQALVRQREIEFNAAKKLNKKGFSSDTTFASAQAQLDSAKAQVTAMKIRLNDLVITAPFDGYIENRYAEIGDFVKDGNPIATIVESDPLLITGQISELQVGKIEVGSEGSAKLVTGETVTGKVKFIGRVANPETRTFRVELEVPNEGYKLRSGVTAEITFKASSVKAHFLSPAFLTLNDKGVLGLRAVGPDDVVEFHPVRILADTPDGIWVDGLPDTVRLIVVGQDFVRAGDTVKPDLFVAEAAQ